MVPQTPQQLLSQLYTEDTRGPVPMSEKCECPGMPIQAAPTAIVATLAFLNVCALTILLLAAAFLLRPARGQRLPGKEANNPPAVP
ncbi:uncharacterized protein RBU57_015337 isoform 2-T2 [Macrochelys suwanniensis]